MGSGFLETVQIASDVSNQAWLVLHGECICLSGTGVRTFVIQHTIDFFIYPYFCLTFHEIVIIIILIVIMPVRNYIFMQCTKSTTDMEESGQNNLLTVIY